MILSLAVDPPQLIAPSFSSSKRNSTMKHFKTLTDTHTHTHKKSPKSLFLKFVALSNEWRDVCENT